MYSTRHHEFRVCKRRLRVLAVGQAAKAAQDPTTLTDGFVVVVELNRQQMGRAKQETIQRKAHSLSPYRGLHGTPGHVRRR